MVKFIENELAKRRAGMAGADDEDEAAVQLTEEEMLWQTPDELSVRKLEGEETADRWLTGIVEVQLPMDYKLKNIEVGPCGYRPPRHQTHFGPSFLWLIVTSCDVASNICQAHCPPRHQTHLETSFS